LDWCPRGLAITSSEIDVTSIKDENDESENVMGEIELHFLRSYQHLDLDLDLAGAHLARIAWTVPSPPPKGDAPNADGEASPKKRFLLNLVSRESNHSGTHGTFRGNARFC
jgi:hypothetical protein